MAYNRYVNQNGSRVRLTVPEKPPDHGAKRSVSPTARPPVPQTARRQSHSGLDLNGLGQVLKKVLPQGLDTGDILLFAVLLLLYVDSGDMELLIMLGALFL